LQSNKLAQEAWGSTKKTFK